MPPPPEVTYRAWRPSDVPGMITAVDLMSPESVYWRLGIGAPRLPISYFREVLDRAPEEWNAVLAESREEIVAWAEYARLAPGHPHADVAVIVTDPFQRRGVASRLLRKLRPLALRDGVRCFQARINSANRPALRTLESVLPSATPVERRHDEVEFLIDLSAFP
ncbi:GNAT family N-acetyltransferase (plasmid) [Streptomyces sp. BI20]|uniref:GNAT family N-acetyltransferase n=1 Tax=Streptomyces sp. BI20 TaxID=3403460 RepID=UPI003C773923